MWVEYYTKLPLDYNIKLEPALNIVRKWDLLRYYCWKQFLILSLTKHDTPGISQLWKYDMYTFWNNVDRFKISLRDRHT